MGTEGTGALPRSERGALYVVIIAGTVAVLGTLATGRIAFAVSVVLSAALGFGTMAFALRKGREAISAGEPARAGMVAGILLVARLLGLAALMVLATAVPAVLDMWGVVAGLIVSDATLLFTEGWSIHTFA